MVEYLSIDKLVEKLEEGGYDEIQTSKARQWYDNGRKVIVFENWDMSHPALGHRMFMPWDEEELPPHGPDHPSIGLGWRYITSYVADPERAPFEVIIEV